jgi:hypothetical protein
MARRTSPKNPGRSAAAIKRESKHNRVRT